MDGERQLLLPAAEHTEPDSPQKEPGLQDGRSHDVRNSIPCFLVGMLD